MHWQNETTGKLKPIIRRVSNGERLSPEERALMNLYLEQVPAGADPLSLHSMDQTPWSIDEAAAAAAGDPPAAGKRKPERTPENKQYEPPENKGAPKPKAPPPEKHGGKGALGKLKQRQNGRRPISSWRVPGQLLAARSRGCECADRHAKRG